MNEARALQARSLLRFTYIIVPIIVGLDKFADRLVNWSQYVSPALMQYIPLTVAQFLIIVGIIEIVAGLLVWYNARLGGYIVAAWMVAIIINLASMHAYYDIIVRDIVIAVGALALALLS